MKAGEQISISGICECNDKLIKFSVYRKAYSELRTKEKNLLPTVIEQQTQCAVNNEKAVCGYLPYGRFCFPGSSFYDEHSLN